MNLAPQFQHRNLPQHVADHIVLLIAAGELTPGERVFEKDICERLNVSRIPVREAFRLLQAQGVIRAEPNRGSFVTELGSEQIAEMMEVRIVVERIAGRHVIRRSKDDPAILDAVRRCMDALHRAIRNNDRLEYCQADLAFHSTIIELADSPILQPIWESLSRGILVYLMQERRLEESYDRSISDHQRLIELLATGDSQGYEAEIGRHVMAPAHFEAAPR
jgi:DNA-binding GntR family transcriptional regulator